MVVPKYAKLSVKNVWMFVKESEELMKYFPDYNDSQLPDREFMFSVISTKFPQALLSLIREAKDKRAIIEENDDSEIIEILPEIREAIMGVLSHKSK